MKQILKKRWDTIVVAIGLIVGFSAVVMKITGYWPCDIINMVSGTYLC